MTTQNRQKSPQRIKVLFLFFIFSVQLFCLFVGIFSSWQVIKHIRGLNLVMDKIWDRNRTLKIKKNKKTLILQGIGLVDIFVPLTVFFPFFPRPIITTNCLSRGQARRSRTHLYRETCLSLSTSSRSTVRIQRTQGRWLCLRHQECYTRACLYRSSKSGRRLIKTWWVFFVCVSFFLPKITEQS